MAGNGTVFLAALTSRAPAGSKVAISVHNVTAVSAGVTDRTPTMAPSARPSASMAEKKASGGDETTVVVLVVVVVVVVVVVILLAGLVAVWFRFYGKKRLVDSGVEANADGPGNEEREKGGEGNSEGVPGSVQSPVKNGGEDNSILVPGLTDVQPHNDCKDGGHAV